MADDPVLNQGGDRARHFQRQQRPLRSIESRIHSYVRFINRTQRSVDVFWLNYAGERQKYTTLNPGDTYKLNTYVTHPFIFRDAETSAKLIINSDEVYFPKPWREGQNILGQVVPWYVPEYIIIPLYTLRERAVQVVRSCLKDPKESYSLDIPQSLMTTIAEYTV